MPLPSVAEDFCCPAAHGMTGEIKRLAPMIAHISVDTPTLKHSCIYINV